MFQTSNENLPEIKEMCEKTVIDLLKVEQSHFLGRDSYEGASEKRIIVTEVITEAIRSRI
jgi:hypothetical protein